MAGRQTDFCSSSYVTGNLTTKASETFTKAVQNIENYKEYAAGLEDERLGFTLRAASEVMHKLRTVIHNIEHSKGNRRFGKKNLDKRHGQKRALRPFLDALEAEYRKRQSEEGAIVPEQEKAAFATPREWDKAKELLTDAANGKDTPVEEIIEPAGSNLLALFKGVPFEEVLQFAANGVEAVNCSGLKKENEKLQKELEQTKASLEHQKKRVEAKEETIKKLRQEKQEDAKLLKAARAFRKAAGLDA